MAFRTLVISSHSKIEYSLNYFVFRNAEGVKRVHLDEVSTVIFESTNISITSSILVEMLKRKINIIFCDEKHNPLGQLSLLSGAHNNYKRIVEQLNWSNKTKELLWQEIIKHKIISEAETLKKYNLSEKSNLLLSYAAEVQGNDCTNREGHAAKVYFNCIFYEGFSRGDDSKINIFLNYGYSILLSLFNRAVVAGGYLTQLGIHHKNEYNQFNFSCDCMEPFRVLVDQFAKQMYLENESNKDKMLDLLKCEISICGKMQTLNNAIIIYTNSIFDSLNNNDVGKIKFPDSYAL